MRRIPADHARHPASTEADKRPEPLPDRADERASVGAETVLGLQRAYGNQVVQRMLAPAARSGTRLVQRYDPTFTYGPGDKTIELTPVEDQDELNDAVESVIDEHFDGYRSLFQKNTVASSPNQWRDLLYGYVEEAYELKGLGRNEVLIAVNALKDKYRGEALLHMANAYVDWSEDPPYSADNLRDRLDAAGAYLDDKDDDALEAIFETEGRFARAKVEVAPGNKELSDEDNIVVLMDDHQQKHQSAKIPEFKAYTGEPGTKFSDDKDLQWHIDNTVPVVRETIAAAVEARKVTRTKNFSPPKDAINGIIYDLTISYDDETGKYVGTYHCNPVRDESG